MEACRRQNATTRPCWMGRTIFCFGPSNAGNCGSRCVLAAGTPPRRFRTNCMASSVSLEKRTPQMPCRGGLQQSHETSNRQTGTQNHARSGEATRLGSSYRGTDGMPGTTRQKCGTKCENILMADTCVQPCLKNAAFDSNWRSFPRHVVRHAALEGSVPLRVPRILHSPEAVSPPKPPLAAASSGGPRGTACPSRLAPGSGGPARSRAFRPAGNCPGNYRSDFVRSGRRSVQRSGDGWPRSAD